MRVPRQPDHPAWAASATAPPFTGARFDRIGVVVPVNNEELALRACLIALLAAAARVSIPVDVIVVLDACTDQSAPVTGEFDGRGVRAMAVDAGNVGIARAAGMTELLSRHGVEGTWLATTDGDSTVPSNWFTAQLRYAAAGARVVAGTVVVQDWGDRTSAVRARARLEYRRGAHRHVHGANLSFAGTAYGAAGGFAPLISGEDVHLVDAFRANDEPIRWATDLPVVTSARRTARAPRGFANYLTELEDSLESSHGA